MSFGVILSYSLFAHTLGDTRSVKSAILFSFYVVSGCCLELGWSTRSLDFERIERVANILQCGLALNPLVCILTSVLLLLFLRLLGPCYSLLAQRSLEPGELRRRHYSRFECGTELFAFSKKVQTCLK